MHYTGSTSKTTEEEGRLLLLLQGHSLELSCCAFARFLIDSPFRNGEVAPRVVSLLSEPFSLRGARPTRVSVFHALVIQCVGGPVFSLTGESVVPELHGASVLLSAASRLLLCRESLPHDAAGEAPAVFHSEVQDTPTHALKTTNWQTLRDSHLHGAR